MENNYPDPRFWDKQYRDWCVDDSNYKPGPHPWPDHLWNTHPEMYDVVEQEKYMQKVTFLVANGKLI